MRVCSQIGGELLRSGISVGAHYEEAQGAESGKILFTRCRLLYRN